MVATTAASLAVYFLFVLFAGQYHTDSPITQPRRHTIDRRPACNPNTGA